MAFACPCCEYLTLDHEPPGSGEKCSECGWIDDSAQSTDPELVEGPNEVSLSEAREIYERVNQIPDLPPRRSP